MASIPMCDGCGAEATLFMVNNVNTGASQYMGMMCYTMMGLIALKEADVESLDELVKAVGYQLSPAERKARKEAAGPEFDEGRTIAEVVESAPRPPGDESVDQLADESVGGQSDLSISDTEQSESVFILDPADHTLKTEAEFVADHTEDAPPY